MAHLIDIRDMYKIYNPGENEVRALDGVSLTIERGEFVAIVGQSGSGKSTLMNMLGLLDVASSGTYFLDGKDVAHFTDDELSEIRNKQIGFIFQGFNLISSLTAQANVELPLVYRGMHREERGKLSLAALERVGLSNRKNHLPVNCPAASSSARPSQGLWQRSHPLYWRMNRQATWIPAPVRMLCGFCTNSAKRAGQLSSLRMTMRLPKPRKE